MRIRTPRREYIDPDHGASFRVATYRPHAWPFAWHDHPECEFTAILAGSGLRYVGDSVQAFAPGDVCLLGPLLPHTWTSTPVRGRHCGSIVVQFPAQVGGVGIALAELSAVRAVVARAARGLRLRGSLARAAIEDLQIMAGDPDPLSRLTRLWRAVARCADAGARHLEVLASPAQAHQPSGDHRLAKVLAWIAAHADQDLPLMAAARVAGLGEAGFCRWFRRRTGRTFVAYRNAVRVGLARRRLLDSDDPVTAIAFAAGFGSLANFNRRFRAETGTTPRAFRQAQP